MVYPRTSRALWRVVELDKHKVEPHTSGKLSKVGIWNDTLRCSREVVVLGGVLGKVDTLKSLDHLGVSAGAVVIDGNTLGVLWNGRNLALNVKVESVNDCITERPRTGSFGPSSSLWAESAPEKVGKSDSTVIVCEVLVCWVAATQRKQDLLAIGLLASLDIRSNVGASGKQVGGHTLGVLVFGGGASIAKVGARIAALALVGKDVDEANVDNVYIRVLAGLDESFLVWSLTLHMTVSICKYALARELAYPVDCYIGLCGSRKGKSRSREKSDNGRQSRNSRVKHFERLCGNEWTALASKERTQTTFAKRTATSKRDNEQR